MVAAATDESAFNSIPDLLPDGHVAGLLMLIAHGRLGLSDEWTFGVAGLAAPGRFRACCA